MSGVDQTVVISPIYSQEDCMESIMFQFLKTMCLIQDFIKGSKGPRGTFVCFITL